jgi:hypothetical protein
LPSTELTGLLGDIERTFSGSSWQELAEIVVRCAERQAPGPPCAPRGALRRNWRGQP